MTGNLKRPLLVWALLCCIVLVNGSMAAPSVGHAEHHAKHQAGTHSTGICAWLCAAGQDIEPSSIHPPPSALQLVERTIIVPIDVVFDAVFYDHSLRGRSEE